MNEYAHAISSNTTKTGMIYIKCECVLVFSGENECTMAGDIFLNLMIFLIVFYLTLSQQ